MVRHLLPLLPLSLRCYFEPFIGGGALFFAAEPAKSVLSGKNPDLINCYVQVRDNPADVICCLATMRNTPEDYYAIRETETEDKIEKAARLIYLMALSFNGIHRVNLNGKFNVPYGHKVNLDPCDERKIFATSAALANTELKSLDFEDAVEIAWSGDLVYFDPPYTVAHGNNGFIKYNAKI